MCQTCSSGAFSDFRNNYFHWNVFTYKEGSVWHCVWISLTACIFGPGFLVSEFVVSLFTDGHFYYSNGGDFQKAQGAIQIKLLVG